MGYSITLVRFRIGHYGTIAKPHALIVQWTERFRPKEKTLVRFRVRAQTSANASDQVAYGHYRSICRVNDS